MRSDIFWDESKSSLSQFLGIGPDDGNAIGSANWEDSLRGGKVSDRGGVVAAELLQAKEDVEAPLERSGIRGVWF